MIALRLTVMAICGGLFAWGGFSWHNARRFIMPLVLTLTCLYITRDLWSLAMLTSSAAFCIGYGDKSIFRRIFGNGWGRGAWGFLAATCLSLPLFLTHHLSILFFFPYLILCFTLENALKNINQIIGDLIIGASFASLILFVHA